MIEPHAHYLDTKTGEVGPPVLTEWPYLYPSAEQHAAQVQAQIEQGLNSKIARATRKVRCQLCQAYNSRKRIVCSRCGARLQELSSYTGDL